MDGSILTLRRCSDARYIGALFEFWVLERGVER